MSPTLVRGKSPAFNPSPTTLELVDDSGITGYTTVRGEHRHVTDVRRSRFITVIRRIASEDDARLILTELRREFHDARHHCSAVVLGPDRSVQRANDDGEPSGTAGAPMLDAILRRESTDGQADLSDLAVVVVRYFGGVLLGAGGLVRAYSDAVSQGLDSAPGVRRRLLQLLAVPVAHTDAGRVENELRHAGVDVLGTDYSAERATLQVAIPAGDASIDGFRARLASLTAGQSGAQLLDLKWVDCD
ncbi:YigZ family protein [Arthrobacter flavus]|uniref:IMPACT family protein n=1 Tax=Arthrobacter flavus TaxID=95172 RepID=A0ABW4Q7C1_9MICC